MANPTARSQTDFDVLKSSQRGKVVAIIGAVAVLTGLYFASRGGPIGEPERGDAVLLIRSGTLSQRHVLREYGFKIAEAEFSEAQERAKQELPEFEGTGVAAILQLADLKGYGYVAFENPSSYEFDDIDLAERPEGLDTARWAVVSAGDFAFPHHMTLSPESVRALKGHELDLLEALFEQDLLAKVRDEEATKPQQIFVLRTNLKGALERLKDIDLAVETIAKIHADTRKQLVDEEQRTPAPSLLGTSEESVKPFALADGGILTIRRTASFASYTGVTADIDLSRTFEFMYSPPGNFDPESRVVCTSILGGELPQKGPRPRFRMDPSGHNLVIDDGHDPHAWRIDPQGQCTFKDLGSVGFTTGDRQNLGVPYQTGAVARVRSDGAGGAALEIVEPGKPPTVAFETDSLALGQPVWIDERHLAMRARPENSRVTGILLIDRDRNDRQLWLRPEIAGLENPTVSELAAIPQAGKPALAAVIGSDNATRQLTRIELGFDLKTRIAELPPQQDPVDSLSVTPSEGEDPLAAAARQQAAALGPSVAFIPPTDVRYTRLYEANGVTDPIASPDGTQVAFRLYADRGMEIAVAASDGSKPATVLTQNELDDHTPTFTADGKHIVFHTRYKLRNTTWTLTAGRVIPVE